MSIAGVKHIFGRQGDQLKKWTDWIYRPTREWGRGARGRHCGLFLRWIGRHAHGHLSPGCL